jgi:peptide/nickel transport system substrate-binding protein
VVAVGSCAIRSCTEAASPSKALAHDPPLDVQKVLPESVDAENYGHYQDETEIALYDKMLRTADPAAQRAAMRQFEKRVLDDQVHAIFLLWWQRIVPYRSYVEGWKINPSHYVNQDLSTIWLEQ